MTQPRVIVPHVEGGLVPETRAALQDSGLRHELIVLDEMNTYAYANLLVVLWRRRETFIIVEQDMVPTPGQLRSLAECGHEWCGYSYFCGESRVYMSFGIVRIDAKVMFDHPTLARQAAIVAGNPHRPTPWWSLAENMAAKLMITGHTWHDHGGLVEHAHGRGAYPGPWGT